MTTRKAKDLLEVGRDQVKGGQFAAAIATLSKALEVDPLRSEAYHLRALARVGLGQIVGSESDFAQAIETSSLDEAAGSVATKIHDGLMEEIAAAQAA